MSLYIKSVLINFPQEVAKYVSYSYCSVHIEFTLVDMNMVKVVNKLLSHLYLSFLSSTH